jgi:hypothetical protein
MLRYPQKTLIPVLYEDVFYTAWILILFVFIKRLILKLNIRHAGESGLILYTY